MNKYNSPFFRHRFAGQALILACGLWLCASASAQVNLVRNPGFESPVGTNAYGNALGGANFPLGTSTGGEAFDPTWKATWNWMIAYPWGGPDDFEIKDRCTTVRGGSANYFSARLRPATDKWAHAYYTQTITNLVAGHAYLVTGFMMEDRWKGVTDPLRDQLQIYIEAVGGQGNPTADGRFSLLATNNLTDYHGNPETNIDGPPYIYPTTIWRPFYTPQTPDANRQIEIRLHLNKPGFCVFDKLELMSAYFDDISVTY